MTSNQFVDLYERYLQGRCTAGEKAQLAAYQDDFKLVDFLLKMELHARDELKQHIWRGLYMEVNPLKNQIK